MKKIVLKRILLAILLVACFVVPIIVIVKPFKSQKKELESATTSSETIIKESNKKTEDNNSLETTVEEEKKVEDNIVNPEIKAEEKNEKNVGKSTASPKTNKNTKKETAQSKNDSVKVETTKPEITAENEQIAYTDEFKEYQQLSDEEKAKIDVIPREYEVPQEEIVEIIEEQKEDLEEEPIPEKFNLKDKIDIKVENQGEYGTCWAFSILNCIETNIALRRNINYDFSEMHFEYMKSYYNKSSIGGFSEGGYFMCLLSYVMYSGPVLEEDIPYREYSQEEYLEFPQMEPVTTVTKTVDFPRLNKQKASEEEIKVFRDAVKTHIMNYGSVYAAIKASDYDIYNNSWNYNGNEYTNHAVSIIGWDDNYSKENFRADMRPSSDGAYIVLNSWGSAWGENGIFYISYEDKYVETQMCGVVSTEMDEKYTHEIDKIENEVVKEVIDKELMGENIEYQGKKYVSDYMLTRIRTLDLSNRNLTSIKDLELFQNLYSINLSNNNIKNLDNLTKINSLNVIDLSGNNNIDISGLKNCKDLSEIILSKCNNVIGLEELENIERIDLSYSNVKDVSELTKFKQLEYLNLTGNKGVKGYSQINSLQYLILKDCELEKLENLAKINQLLELDISDNKIKDISQIENLTQIYILDISNNYGISGLDKYNTELARNAYLIRNKLIDVTDIDMAIIFINASGCGIKNLDEFVNLSYLSVLNLSNNELTDVSQLFDKDISSLYLSGNKNLSNLDKLNKIEYLRLEDCNISDLTEISKLNQLKFLDLNNNKVKNINLLNGLYELTELDLSNNEIEGELYLFKLSALYLENCGLTTESDIGNFISLISLDISNNNITNLDTFLTNINTRKFLNLKYEREDGMLELEDVNKLLNKVRSFEKMKIHYNIEISKDEQRIINFEEDEQLGIIAKETFNSMSSIKKYECNNCSVTEDKKGVIINEGLGNTGSISITIRNSDKFNVCEIIIDYTIVD